MRCSRLVLSVLAIFMLAKAQITFSETLKNQQCFQVDVPPSSLAEAITTLARQTGAKLLFSYDLARAKQARPVVGCFPLNVALSLLLDGSGLTSGLSKKGLMTIAPVGSEVFANEHNKHREEIMNVKMKKNILAVAVGSFLAGGVFGDEGSQEGIEWLLEEVIVTATKRAQSLQDTAMSISALSSDTINKRNLVGMGDYLSALPGVNVLDQGPGFNSIIIRGVTLSPQNEGQIGNSPVSGAYFGETAISGLGLFGNASDIKLVDMERIEVLRGPQGTLYGDGAMGGAVRNIPAAPNLSQLEGELSAGYSNTGGEGDTNNVVKGVINIPIIRDTLAVRAVAYRFDNSGYYKNIAASDPLYSGLAATNSGKVLNTDDLGSNEVVGGRISVLWKPTDDLSINLSYLNQDIEQDGWAQTDLALSGSYLQRRFEVRTDANDTSHFEGEGYIDNIELTNLIIEYDLGWATVLSSTSLVDEDVELTRELSALVAGNYPWGQTFDPSSNLFSEEIRLASNFDGEMQFLMGFYYQEKGLRQVNGAFYSGTDLSLSSYLGLTPPGDILLLSNALENETTQRSFFGEASYEISEQTKLTIGGRYFDYDRTRVDEFFASGLRPEGAAPVKIESSEDGVSLKAGLEYTPSDDSLYYATWSEGFRLGAPVRPPSSLTLASCDLDGDGNYDGSNGISLNQGAVESDTLESFEVGSKISLLNNRLTVNAAVYQTNWDGIPVNVTFRPLCGIILNVGEAKTRGVEFDTAYYWNENLHFNFSASYVDAKLTEDAPTLDAVKGDRLPGSSRFNASLGIEYAFYLSSYDAYVRSDYTYLGGFYNNLQEEGSEIGDYGKINVKAGISIAQFNIDLYVDNLTNEDELTWVDNDFADTRGNRLKPRTVGFNVSYQF